MRRSEFLRCISLAVVLAVHHVPSAHADGSEDRVDSYRDAVRRGAELFRSADYDEAREHFQRAYRLHPAPILLFNIASTYRRQRRHNDALRFYRRFVSAADTAEPRRRLALETIAHLEQLVREQRALAERDTREHERIDPLPVAAPSSPPLALSRRLRTRPRSWTLTLAGVGVSVAGAAGLAMAWRESREVVRIERELSAAAAAGQPWDAAQQQAYDRGQQGQTRALAWAIAGGVAVIGGTVLFVMGRPVRLSTTGRDVLVSTAF